MNSFYLELVSNASSQVYPQNTMASFTNFLPDKIELDESWEVAANLGVEADKPVMPYSKGSYNTKSRATADLPFDITGTHTVLLYSDIVEPNSVGDVKCPLLRSFPFKHREFHNDEIFKKYQVLSYRRFEQLRFHKVIKSNFHSIHVELRNAAGHLVPFFPIRQVHLTFLFQKKS